MTRRYRKYDEDFRQGAVQLVIETGKPIAQAARELGVDEGTLGNWCAKHRRAADDGEAPLSESELARLRKEIIELRMQRDVLKRSVAPQHGRREQLTTAIRRLFAQHRGSYGRPRITADLREERGESARTPSRRSGANSG